MTYIYEPSYLDNSDPKVIVGKPITTGAKVYITKENIDPDKHFIFIEDDYGNVQSVYKNSLTKVYPVRK